MKTTLAILFCLILAAALVAPASPADDGESLYNAKCAMCHGKDGVARKMAKGSADLNDPEWQDATPLEAIEKVTAEGKGKMPKFKTKLTPEQIKLIAAYIKTLK